MTYYYYLDANLKDCCRKLLSIKEDEKIFNPLCFLQSLLGLNSGLASFTFWGWRGRQPLAYSRN
jgi:hypothetical protein